MFVDCWPPSRVTGVTAALRHQTSVSRCVRCSCSHFPPSSYVLSCSCFDASIRITLGRSMERQKSSRNSWPIPRRKLPVLGRTHATSLPGSAFKLAV